jgi:beta-glucosidase
MCANKKLLKGTLKGAWGFEGAVVSDCSAVSNVLLSSPSTSLPQAAANALTAGTDMNCGDAYNVLNESIAQGLAHTSDVDAAIARTLLGRRVLSYSRTLALSHARTLALSKHTN